MLETSLTGRPASLRDFAVPPEATKVNPNSCNFLANGKRFVLSETLKSAANVEKRVLKIY